MLTINPRVQDGLRHISAEIKETIIFPHLFDTNHKEKHQYETLLVLLLNYFSVTFLNLRATITPPTKEIAHPK